MAKNESAVSALAESKPGAVYTKEQLKASKRYTTRQDLLSALLEDGKSYTLTEVDALIEKFMKGKVK